MKPCIIKFQKHVTLSELNLESSDNGMHEALSKQYEHLEGCDCLISPLSIHPLPSEKQMSEALCSTHECHLQSKKMTLLDKKNISEIIYLTNIPDAKLTTYQTLAQALTLKDPDCYKFWDLSRKELYQQLSWLQKTDLPDLELSSLNGCVNNTELKSWFSTLKIQHPKMNLEKTSWQSSKFIVVDGMDKGDILKHKNKCLKLKLNPTKTQRLELNRWAGCVRFLYNKTIALLTNPKNKTIRSEYDLRDRLCTLKSRATEKENSFYRNKPWLKTCPKSIKQGAIGDARSNLKSCFTNHKNKNIKKFRSPFRTKKNEQLRGWSYSLEKNNISKKGDQLFIFPTLLKDMKYFGTKQLHKIIPEAKPMMDCKIQKNAFGEYFLIVPYKCIPQKPKKTCEKPVAVDPGIRKFATTYAPNQEESFMLGNRWATKITEVCLQLDKLYSSKAKTKTAVDKQPRRKRAIKMAINIKRKRITHLKQELHYQCANFISKRYDLIMMPKLEAGKLCMKKNRRLTTKTARSFLNAGHGKFFDILKDKCWQNGSHFLHSREEYTSQTCPNCGCLNKCNETYQCKKCHFKNDRDIVGAFNILLKGVREKKPHQKFGNLDISESGQTE